jgi:hypothetical protein
MNLLVTKESFKWWNNRLLKFNGYAIISGLFFLVCLYIISFFTRPIYFFFLIPLCIIYLFLLNGCFYLGWFLFEINFQNKNSIQKNIKRVNYFRRLIYLCILMNLIVFILFIIEYSLRFW